MPKLDPDDLKVLEDAKAGGGILLTFDRPIREYAGLPSVYEALEQAEREAPEHAPAEAVAELRRLRTLTPEQLTRLADAADETHKYFLEHIQVVDTTSALLIRNLRVNEAYSWRAIAREMALVFNAPWGGNQIAGMVICKKAAEMLGENFMKEPWN